ncbi:hypothetical protein Tco_0006535 [Tanacetum coccineum]
MDQDSAHMLAASKVPMLKPENGATLPKTKIVEGVTTELPITSAEDKAQRRLEVKDRMPKLFNLSHQIIVLFLGRMMLQGIAKVAIGGDKVCRGVGRHRGEERGRISCLVVRTGYKKMMNSTWRLFECFKVGKTSPLRNKADMDTMSMDDLYSNLKVYEPEVKRMSSSSSSTQNMAFVSSSNNNTSSTNEAVNTAHGISTASTQVNVVKSTNIDNLSDVVICAFFTSQPNSPQLAHEDLQQIHPDDMKEMDLRWQMAMLTMRARSPKWSATTATRGDILLGSAELQEIKTTRTRKAQEGVCLWKYLLLQLWCHVMVLVDMTKVIRQKKGLIMHSWLSHLQILTQRFRNISKPAVLVNTARQVNATHSKTTVNAARSMSYLSKIAHSTVKRPIHKNTTFKNSNFNQRVNTVRGNNFNTARPKAVVNAVKGNNVNVVKASACWVWKPKTKVLDHVSKHDSASITIKKFDYVDAQGSRSNDGCQGQRKEHVLSH